MSQNPNPTLSVVSAVQALLAKYQSDPTFKSAFDAAASVEAAVRVAAQYGIDVSREDLQAMGPVSDDVSDALLDKVAGGTGPTGNIPASNGFGLK